MLPVKGGEEWMAENNCPLCGSGIAAGASECPNCGAKLHADKSEDSLSELMKIPGVGHLRAQALFNAGYSTLHKIAGARFDDLAKVPSIGIQTAERIKKAVQEIGVEELTSRELDEDEVDEEITCPLCGTILGIHDRTCYECGNMVKTGEEDRGELEKALATYTRRLKKRPDDPELLYAEGAIFEKLGRNDDALKSFEKVVELSPGFTGIWHAMADVYAKLGQHEKAAECYMKTIQDSFISISGEAIPSAFDEEAMEDEFEDWDEEEDEDDDEFQCPECGSDVPSDANVCPTCGVEFEEEDEEELGELEDDLAELEELEAFEFAADGAVEVTIASEPEIEEEEDAALVGLESLYEVTAEEAALRGTEDILHDLEDLLKDEGPPESEPAAAGGETEQDDALDMLDELDHLIPVLDGAIGEEPPGTEAEEAGLEADLAEMEAEIEVEDLPQVEALADFDVPVEAEAEAEAGAEAEGEIPGPVSARTRWIAIGAVAAAFIVIFAAVGWILLLPTDAPVVESGFTIDGAFDEWSSGDAIIYDDMDQGTAGLDLQSISLYKTSNSVFLYAATGTPVSGSAQELRVFIDADGRSGTGYSIRGTGAEHMVRLTGDSPQAMLWSFIGRDHLDWRGWIEVGPVESAASGGQMEIRADMDVIGGSGSSDVEALFYAGPEDGTGDYSQVIGGTPGALLVRQSPSGLSEVTPGNASAPVTRLIAVAGGGDVTLDSLTVSFTSTCTHDDLTLVSLYRDANSNGQYDAADTLVASAQPASASPFTLAPSMVISAGEQADLFITADVATTAVPGRVVGLGLASRDSVSVAGGSVTLVKLSGEGPYVNSLVPAAVDGRFGEWGAGVPDAADASPPRIDIVAANATQNGNVLLFHAVVSGVMLEGKALPLSAGQAGIVSGEDRLYAYVDRDNQSATGYQVGGIGAEYVIEVSGVEGQVTSGLLRRYTGTGADSKWAHAGFASAFASGNQLEGGVELSLMGLGPQDNFSVVLRSADCLGNSDEAAAMAV